MEHAIGETGRAIDAVRIRLARAETGLLRAHVPVRGECSIYMMDGEIIGALTDEDAEAVVHRLVARGRLSAEQASSLKDEAEGRPLDFEMLHASVDEALVGRLMAGRFRDNLIFHIFDGGRFVFEALDTVRIPHLQMGHDSAGLLRELEMVHDRIRPWLGLYKLRTMTLGEHTAGSPQQRHIQALCSSGLRLDRLLRASPFFPAQTLVLVDQMVDGGSLMAAEIEAGDGPDPGAISHAIQMAKVDRMRRSEVTRARDEQGVAVQPTGGSSLSAFADHDQGDRGLGQGAFMGDKDRVDLGRNQPTKTPGLRLRAPTLSTTEVVRRIGVCNEVLTALVDAWTDQYGAGEARQIAQLLVDGAPLSSAAVFRGAQVDSRGRMSATVILENLGRRPEGEQRELITKGLFSLIDRTLARAAEGLDEDRLSKMLSQAAGYRQRMGW